MKRNRGHVAQESKSRRRAVLTVSAILAAAALGGLGMFAVHAPRAAEPAALAPVAVAPATVEAAPAVIEVAPPAPVAEQTPPAEEESLSDREFKRLRRNVFAMRPALGLFKGIQEKAIRTPQETATALSIMADPKRIEDAHKDLTNHRDQRGLERGMLRMYQVDFLTNSLAWEGHPHRADLLQTVDDVLRETRYRGDVGGPTRASMNVDRYELFEAYMKYAPEDAEKTLAALQGTPIASRLEPIAKKVRHQQALAQNGSP